MEEQRKFIYKESNYFTKEMWKQVRTMISREASDQMQIEDKEYIVDLRKLPDSLIAKLCNYINGKIKKEENTDN